MKIIEGIGFGVSGHEEDYFSFIDPERDCLSMSGLLPETVNPYLNMSIITEHDEKQYDDTTLKDWRKKSGKQFPTLYKLKITTECEPLSEAESVAYWLSQQQKYKEAKESRT